MNVYRDVLIQEGKMCFKCLLSLALVFCLFMDG